MHNEHTFGHTSALARSAHSFETSVWVKRAGKNAFWKPQVLSFIFAVGFASEKSRMCWLQNVCVHSTIRKIEPCVKENQN